MVGMRKTRDAMETFQPEVVQHFAGKPLKFNENEGRPTTDQGRPPQATDGPLRGTLPVAITEAGHTGEHVTRVVLVAD